MIWGFIEQERRIEWQQLQEQKKAGNHFIRPKSGSIHVLQKWLVFYNVSLFLHIIHFNVLIMLISIYCTVCDWELQRDH